MFPPKPEFYGHETTFSLDSPPVSLAQSSKLQHWRLRWLSQQQNLNLCPAFKLHIPGSSCLPLSNTVNSPVNVATALELTKYPEPLLT